ncbi:MAG: hydrogenase nickel incorporation protein HypB [Ardenticatenaceae bacterium]|nr:hydrogenase nickel incorporation protein HypB [Ardenticatenaceae bacterium]
MRKNVKIVEDILSANDDLASQNHSKLQNSQTLGINVMASPGSGKTSVILQTIKALQDAYQIGVVEGDTAAVTIDADKIISAGMPAVQINTGGSCHLDAVMLSKALPEMPLENIDLLIVENVGNLICPAAFTLGTHFNIVIASVPEGDDKPYKYPNIYRGIDALILNKMDLLPYIDFDVDYFKKGVQILNPGVSFFDVSCKTGEGIDAWAKFLRERIEGFRSQE